MPTYNYTALKSGKDIVQGKLEAASIKEAREALRNNNLIPTKIEESGQKTQVKSSGKAKEKGSLDLDFLFKKKPLTKITSLKMREKIDFVNSIFFLSRTGIPLVESLLFVENNVKSEKVKFLCSDLRKNILIGYSLSDALARHKGVFDRIFSGLIKAGEESGELDSTLERIVFLLEKQKNLKNKIVTIMVYPVFVVFLAMVVTLIMLTFVFPAFQQVYNQMGRKLPALTQFFMDTGIFLKNNVIIIPFIFIFLGGFLYFINKWPVSKKILDKVALKIPFIKNFVIFSALSNYITVMKVSFDAGVTIINSLILANLTVQNYTLIEKFSAIPSKIQQGESLSNSLKETQIIPGIVMCMIATGEQAGQLGEVLGNASLYVDEELDRVIDLLSRLLEPCLLVVIAVIVLLLMLALYLPMFNAYSNIVS